MIVGLRWLARPLSAGEAPVLQFREEHGPWRNVETVVLPLPGATFTDADLGRRGYVKIEDTVAGDSAPPDPAIAALRSSDTTP